MKSSCKDIILLHSHCYVKVELLTCSSVSGGGATTTATTDDDVLVDLSSLGNPTIMFINNTIAINAASIISYTTTFIR